MTEKKLLLLRDVINAVRAFHDAFGVENADQKTLVSPETFLLRYKLMREENEEYLEACENEDLVEIADALGDLLYIWAGTVLKHGLHEKIDEIFTEIQRSNMSKLDANGNPIINDGKIDPIKPVGKVLKGPNFSPPNIAKILGE